MNGDVIINRSMAERCGRIADPQAHRKRPGSLPSESPAAVTRPSVPGSVTTGSGAEATTTFDYDPQTDVLTRTVVDAGGLNLTSRTLTWDSLGRPRTVSDPMGIVTSYTYSDALAASGVATCRAGILQSMVHNATAGITSYDGADRIIQPPMSHRPPVTLSPLSPNHATI